MFSMNGKQDVLARLYQCFGRKSDDKIELGLEAYVLSLSRQSPMPLH